MHELNFKECEELGIGRRVHICRTFTELRTGLSITSGRDGSIGIGAAETGSLSLRGLCGTGGAGVQERIADLPYNSTFSQTNLSVRANALAVRTRHPRSYGSARSTRVTSLLILVLSSAPLNTNAIFCWPPMLHCRDIDAGICRLMCLFLRMFRMTQASCLTPSPTLPAGSPLLFSDSDFNESIYTQTVHPILIQMLDYAAGIAITGRYRTILCHSTYRLNALRVLWKA